MSTGDHGTILALDGHVFDRVKVWDDGDVFVYEHRCDGVEYILAENGGWTWTARLDPTVWDGSVKFASPLSEPAPLAPLDAFRAARQAAIGGVAAGERWTVSH